MHGGKETLKRESVETEFKNSYKITTWTQLNRATSKNMNN